jgi:hypothetical protein
VGERLDQALGTVKSGLRELDLGDLPRG